MVPSVETPCLFAALTVWFKRESVDKLRRAAMLTGLLYRYCKFSHHRPGGSMHMKRQLETAMLRGWLVRSQDPYY